MDRDIFSAFIFKSFGSLVADAVDLFSLIIHNIFWHVNRMVAGWSHLKEAAVKDSSPAETSRFNGLSFQRFKNHLAHTGLHQNANGGGFNLQQNSERLKMDFTPRKSSKERLGSRATKCHVSGK